MKGQDVNLQVYRNYVLIQWNIQVYDIKIKDPNISIIMDYTIYFILNIPCGT